MSELFREKIGLRDYVIKTEEEKVIEQWRQAIMELVSCLSAKTIDRKHLQALM